MKPRYLLLPAAMLTAAALVAGCAVSTTPAAPAPPSPAELDRQALAMIQASFREQGIAKLDRINQDLGQKACSSSQPPTEAVAPADRGRGRRHRALARRRPVPGRLARG